MRMRFGVAAVLAAAVVWSSAAMAIPADTGLDTSFGTEGMTIVPVGDGDSFPDGSHGLSRQPDGKIVMVGYATVAGLDQFAVMRVDANGALDPTFGAEGVVTTPIGPIGAYARGVTVQADGTVIVVGPSNSPGALSTMVRYTANGVLDPTFGLGGVVTTSVGASNDSPRAVAVQPDGRIVVAGSTFNGSNNDFSLVRYTATGELDIGFGAGGMVTTPIGLYDDIAMSMALSSDGSILVAGYAGTGMVDNFAVVKYTSTGTLDTGFGVGGKVTTSVTSGTNVASTMALHTDGRIVVAGRTGFDWGLVRYLPDGSLDPTFGVGGRVVSAVSPGFDMVRDLVIRSDGSIVVAGATPSSGFTLARLRPDGSLDPTFGVDGVLANPLTEYEDAQAMALDDQGRIVVGGYVQVGTAYHFGVARYHPDGRTPQPQPELVLPPLISEPSTTTTTVAPSTTTTTIVPSPPTSAPDTTLPSPPAAAPPDTFEVLVDGELVESGQTVQQDGTVVITGDDFSLAVQADQGAGLRLSGQGYEPGSQVQAWLFSTPTYLGSATVADDGSFQFEAELNGVDSGAHTLQLTGTAEGGGTRTVNVGIVVAQPGVPTPLPGELPSTGSDAAASWWALLAVVAGVVLVRRARAPMHRRG